jgi:hypothetical protein
VTGTGYHMSMDIREIQIAIEGLPTEQQRTLLDWLAERDFERWDTQIEKDFSEGGGGMELLDRVKRQVGQGHSAPMHEGRNRR